MEKKLISMVDFVLSLSGKQSDLTTIYNYAKFLKQPLTLGMFVPCRSDGKPLEQPIEPEAPYNDKQCDVWQQYEFYKNRYEEAKESVLFEGFQYLAKSGQLKEVYNKNCDCGFMFGAMTGTIESMDTYGLTLTPTALKTIYG